MSDYSVRANQHLPTDPATVAREIRRLAAEGWTEYGIGLVLRLDPAAVRYALGNTIHFPPGARGGDEQARAALSVVRAALVRLQNQPA